MIIDNQLASLASSLTPEQLRGPSPEDAPDRTARPTAPLEGLRPALTDDVSVTVSFVQQVLVQTAIEVIDRRLEKDGDDLTTSPVNAPPVADPTGSASPRAEKIADRVLHRIGKRLDHALKKIARLESRPREDVRHVEKRLTQVVHELSKALSVALRGTFALLREVGVEDNKGGRLLGEIRDRLLPGVGQLATDLENRIRSGAREGIEASAEASVSRERTFSLEVRTQEGDTVTIHVESRTSSSASVDVSRTAEGFSLVATRESLSAQSLTFSVEGDLDADETAAIQDLVRGAEELSNQFFGGDLEAAFAAATELQFDSGEISGFDLELQQSVQARVAATYREVGALGELDEPADAGLAADVPPVPVEERPATSSVEGSTLGFEALLGRLTSSFDVSSLFDNADGLVRQLLAGALQVHPAAGERD